MSYHLSIVPPPRLICIFQSPANESPCGPRACLLNLALVPMPHRGMCLARLFVIPFLLILPTRSIWPVCTCQKWGASSLIDLRRDTLASPRSARISCIWHAFGCTLYYFVSCFQAPTVSAAKGSSCGPRASPLSFALVLVLHRGVSVGLADALFLLT
jgi:hypothetical protein